MGSFCFFVTNVALLGGLIGVTVASPAAGAVLAGLVGVLLVLGPTARERWDRRHAVVRATKWLRTRPDPVTLAFAIGGPDRVTDLIIADLVRHERAMLSDGGLHRIPGQPPASALSASARPLTDAVLAAAAEAPVPIAKVRGVVHEQPLTATLWNETAKAGMVRHPHARGRSQNAALVWALGLGLPLPVPAYIGLSSIDPGPDADTRLRLGWFVLLGLVELASVPIVATPLIVYFLLLNRISGYGPDPRTQAGLRLADLAAAEQWAATGAYPEALAGAVTDPGRWQLDLAPDKLDAEAKPEALKDSADEPEPVADDVRLSGDGR